MLVAPTLAKVALTFGPPEYAALMILSLTTIGGLLGESLIKGLITAVLGLMIGTVGIDTQSGVSRFTFGMPELLEGIGFLPVIVGHVRRRRGAREYRTQAAARRRCAASSKRLLPSAAEWAAARMSIVRGTLIGFWLGTLPGIGATAATMIAYVTERRQSRTPERFGKGAIEGVAAPEAANNASATGAMVPLLTLGIPASGTAAVMLAALILNDVRPGPRLFETNPDLVWGVIASMYIGNVMLLILNLPLIGIWVRLIRIRYEILGPATLFFAFIGVYAAETKLFDVYVMIAAGVVGYLLRKLKFPGRPDDPRPGARPAAGGAGAAEPDTVARRPDDFPDAADLGPDHGDRRALPPAAAGQPPPAAARRRRSHGGSGPNRVVRDSTSSRTLRVWRWDCG